MLSKLFNQNAKTITKYLSNITGFTTDSELFLAYLINLLTHKILFFCAIDYTGLNLGLKLTVSWSHSQ